MKKFSSGVAAIAVIALCLYFVNAAQYEKHRELKRQKAEIQESLDNLQARSAEIDGKLAEARKTLPPAGTLEEAARQLEARSQAEIVTLEKQFSEAAAVLKQTEAEVTALRQQTAANGAAQ